MLFSKSLNHCGRPRVRCPRLGLSVPISEMYCSRECARLNARPEQPPLGLHTHPKLHLGVQPTRAVCLHAHKPQTRLEKRDVTGPSPGYRQGRPVSGHTVRKVGERAPWDLESGLAMRMPCSFSSVFGLDASAASVLARS